jgi:hypothetical protein
MNVIDPGHRYQPFHLDGAKVTFLQFVKRVGEKFPGNRPPSAQGTTLQEVYRACLDRVIYLNNQQPCDESKNVAALTIASLKLLEDRAARLHGRQAPKLDKVVNGPFCPKCGHAGCKGECGHA